MTTAEIRREADPYLKTVRWSDEDECYVGTLHDLAGDCCHGADPVDVYAQLESLALECVELLHREGKPLPEPTVFPAKRVLPA